MNRLIIGDIHGCYAELQELLSKAGVSSSDEIIALGDLVDRGPESPQVLEFFRSQPNARSLQGNHERKHFRSLAGELQPALAQRITRCQIGEADYPEACAFMRTLERMIELPEALLVHGFFEPGVAPSDQRDTVVIGTLSGEHYLRRHYDRPWYELYDGEKPIIVGHLSYNTNGQPLVWKDRVFGIDTGCCHGGALTGIVLPDFRLVSVPSRADHWPDLRRRYPEVAIEAVPNDVLPWHQLRDRIAALERRSERSPEEAARLAELRALLEVVDRSFGSLLRHVEEENERILTELRAECDFDAMSPAQQGSRYAAKIGSTPISRLLHQARKGELSDARLRRSLKTPRALFEVAAKVGIPGEDEEED